MKDQLSPHFKRSEFACKCGCGNMLYAIELLDVLEDVREHFNAPVIINSAYRCPSHNKAVGGSPTSQHMNGDAADIVVKGFTPKQVADYLESKYPNKYGLGRYKSFTHIDVRKNRGRWGAN